MAAAADGEGGEEVVRSTMKAMFVYVRLVENREKKIEVRRRGFV